MFASNLRNCTIIGSLIHEHGRRTNRRGPHVPHRWLIRAEASKFKHLYSRFVAFVVVVVACVVVVVVVVVVS